VTQPQDAPQGIVGVPTLSALHGQTPQITFNAKEAFRLAYYSSLTAETENNIKITANRYNPNDREAFYVRFIGVGLVAYMHDMTWAYIFKSQILMLQEMNHRNGLLALADAKNFYDKAVIGYPAIYAAYSFEQWIAFMKIEQLLVRHPTDMLEISHRGRDFLKYLAHWGRKVDLKHG